jgi:hypothetical protein
MEVAVQLSRNWRPARVEGLPEVRGQLPWEAGLLPGVPLLLLLPGLMADAGRCC